MPVNEHLYNVAKLVSGCLSNGIKHVVISPGSRNAPLTILFFTSKRCKTYNVVDERSAGFFALGMARQLNEPVALVCTSGTATLNYAPAIAEAYYAQVPLLILTADRPLKWLNQSEGQQIDQREVYRNYCAASFTFDTALKSKLLNQVIPNAFRLLADSSRPVHINVPLDEPLYALDALIPVQPEMVNLPKKKRSETLLTDEDHKAMLCGNILVAVGCCVPNEAFNRIISGIANRNNVAIIAETTSNLESPNIIGNPDLIIPHMDAEYRILVQPDLLITIGTHFISKHLKQFLRSFPPAYHWHIDEFGFFPDTFQVLSHKIQSSVIETLQNISNSIPDSASQYRQLWLAMNTVIRKRISASLNRLPWCEFKAFHLIYEALPQDSILHLGNSMPVRYAQYVNQRKSIRIFSNRGTSGIDGSLSTAIGAANAVKRDQTVILGDLSFMYDSNGLWQDSLPDNLKIIILNNHGGGIFRFIPGPQKYDGFEKHFLAEHNRNFKYTAAQYNIPYFEAENQNELLMQLDRFYAVVGIAILEIKTDNSVNTNELNRYIHQITD